MVAKMFRLVDTHAHLEDIKDLEDSIGRAVDNGVVAVVAVGSDCNSSRFALEISKKKFEGLKVYAALGIHPWGLTQDKAESALEFVKSNVDEAVGIGEVGLDYWYKDARKDAGKKRLQQEAFSAMLKIAKQHDKPVLVHSRGAWEDCVDMAVEAEVKKAIFHWFTGPPEVLKRLLDHGYFVSATPAAEYSKEHRRVIENVPLESLVLETDSPVTYGEVQAEPCHVIKSLSAVAKIKGAEESKVAEETTDNASKIFGINI